MERKHSQEWGKKERYEHVGKDGEPIQLKVDMKAKLRNKINDIAVKLGMESAGADDDHKHQKER